MNRMATARRLGVEAGTGGIEVLPLGFLTFVVVTLVVTNAWAVVDANTAVTAAAREAARAYVEAGPDADPMAEAGHSARLAVEGFGRRGDRLRLELVEGAFARCRLVTFEASYQVPTIPLASIGRRGSPSITASARHTEVVDPYRSGVPAGEGCG